MHCKPKSSEQEAGFGDGIMDYLLKPLAKYWAFCGFDSVQMPPVKQRTSLSWASSAGNSLLR